MPVVESPQSATEIATILGDLAIANAEAGRMLRIGAEMATTGNLRLLFLRNAGEREQFSRELRLVRGRYADDPLEVSKPFAGARRRAWIGVRTVVSGSDDELLLREVRRDADALVAAYRRVLADEDSLPPAVAAVLHRQAEATAVEHDRIRSLCDLYCTS